MAYLVLENGSVFEGQSIGISGDSVGELVFTTGMVGYLETLTDPSYAGQIVLQTFPMIGNYGVIESDFEGKSAVRGYIVRECCEHPSNFRAQYDLDTYLKKQGICGLSGVDTRELTRIIRENGVMNAKICQKIPEDTADIKQYNVTGAVAEVSCKKPSCHSAADGAEKFKVVLVDYGAKKNIVRLLCGRGCAVTVVPHDTPAKDILAMRPDGVMLSNGPGDPTENVYEIEQIQKLLGQIPIFGICLGHQLTALACGGKTVKLKYGHRGANQPVYSKALGRTFITSQNHGYAVVADSVPGGREIFVNANDGSCEGMEYPEKNCFTVQFHPEACAGPRDTEFMFDRFITMMEEKQNAQG